MKEGFISDVQHFCVNDGDGIRTTVFFKGCNLHCAWCHNVECISCEPQQMRYVIGGQESMRTCGKRMTAKALIAEILEDEKFYARSGGGVTFSGGEPLLQADFLAEVMPIVKAHGIHAIIDTAGDVSRIAFDKVASFTDTFFFDNKAANAQDFRKFTGGNFENVTNNLRYLIESGCDVTVRIPVIPEHNFSTEYMEKTCVLLKDCGVKKVQLLPFNRLGSAKYAALGLSYRYKEVPTMEKSALLPLLAICRRYFPSPETKIDG